MDDTGQPTSVGAGFSGLWAVEFPASRGAASAVDFVAGEPLSGTFSFAADTSSIRLVLEVAGDGIVEGDETFTVALSGLDLSGLDAVDSGAFSLGDDRATGTITEPPPQAAPAQARELRLGIADAEVTEPDAGDSVTIGFTVSLVDDTGQSASVSAGFGGDWAVSFPTTGSPASSSDFATGQALSGTFTVAADTSSVDIDLTVAGDEIVEGDEAFTVTISNLDLSGLDTADSDAFTLVDATATGTITEPPPPPQTAPAQAGELRLGIADSEVTEPDTGESATIGFTVSLVDETGQPASVPAAFQGSWVVEFPTEGSPASADDFATGQALSGTFSFGADTSTIEIELTVVGDEIVEADETFTVTLSDLDLSGLDTADSEVFELVDATAAGKILAPPPPRALKLSIADADVTEPDPGESATIAFTVSLVDETGQAASVSAGFSGDWTVEFPTEGSPASSADFATGQAFSGTFTVAADTSSVDIGLTVVGDEITGEGDETFTVTLSALDLSGLDTADSDAFSLVAAAATGTITEPAPPPRALRLSIADAEIKEPAAGESEEIRFAVSLVDETGQPASVPAGFSGNWAVSFPTEGSPASAADFVADEDLSGTFTVAADASSTEIVLEVAGDEIVEGEETFTVALSNLDLSALGAEDSGVFTFSNQAGTGTITDPAPTLPRTLKLSIADAEITEPDAGESAQITFAVSLVDETGQPASVPAGFSGAWAVEFPTTGSPASSADFATDQALVGDVHICGGCFECRDRVDGGG